MVTFLNQLGLVDRGVRADANKGLLAVGSAGRRRACRWDDDLARHGPQVTIPSIALNRGGTLLFVANREADSLTVFAVGTPGPNILTKLAEVTVGEEPVCVASDGLRAFVTNAVSGTVSVVELVGVGVFGETAEIPVGKEPRGCALTGTRLYVTNFTEGTVSVIDTRSKKVVDEVNVRGNPYGITVVGNDVFVTQFFARLIDGGPGEGFDDGKEGLVQHFLRNNFNLDEITLAPLEKSGFTANRTLLCPNIPPFLRRSRR